MVDAPPWRRGSVGVESRAFSAVPVRLPEDDPLPREAAPGELLAVTHATFMAWALSEILADAGSPARELVVEADCTLAGPVADRELVAVDLRVYGHGAELSVEGFREAANAARRRYLRAAGTSLAGWRLSWRALEALMMAPTLPREPSAGSRWPARSARAPSRGR